MSKAVAKEDDFYIGWQDRAPAAYAHNNRRFVIFLFLIAILMAGALVLSQRPFASSVFEFGTISIHEGWLVMEPVPMLKTPTGRESDGTGVFKSVLLTGFGKFGAEATLADLEEDLGEPLQGRAVRLRGTLIHDDGKFALELTEGPASFAGFVEDLPLYSPSRSDQGTATLRGEILDPKCALGVMKPAYGKPHRSCAIRCISGGVPPIVRIRSSGGDTNYVLLLGENGEQIGQDILPYVADEVQICGRLELLDDWLVVYTDPKTDLYRFKPFWELEDIPMCSSNQDE